MTRNYWGVVVILIFSSLCSEEQSYIEFGKKTDPISNPYMHYVEEILEDGKYVLLNDGSVWAIRAKKRWAEISNWEKGDLILLEIMEQSRDNPLLFFLNNVRLNESPSVNMVGNLDAISYLLITEIDGSGREMVLDDGSKWNIDWWESWETCKWKEGDAVAVYQTKTRRPNGYDLINLSQGAYKRHCFATLTRSPFDLIQLRPLEEEEAVEGSSSASQEDY
jgi:hypothetical protein